ncbi:MAG: hypothetical protein ABR587_10280 [Candidatus Binatia bacterium]
MSGAAKTDHRRFVLGYRWLSGQIARATHRVTATYQVHPRLSVGIEYQPETSQVGPLANLLVVEEGDRFPAVMVGTSSDRIGTPSGQLFYATASKDVEAWIGLPVAPYLGISYGTYAEKVRPVAGLDVRLPYDFGALLIFDGVHVHPTVNWTWKNVVLTLILVEGTDPGFATSFAW